MDRDLCRWCDSEGHAGACDPESARRAKVDADRRHALLIAAAIMLKIKGIGYEDDLDIAAIGARALLGSVELEE